MKKIYYFIATFCWTMCLGACDNCLDPHTINPTNPGKAKLTPDLKQYAIPTIVFSNVLVYALSKSVQYVLLGAGDDCLVLRLKESYPDGNRSIWHTDYSGTLQFGDFEDTPKNDESAKEILKRYGTFRAKALREMKDHCEFLTLQECFQKVMGLLVIAAVALMCYTVFSIFNFLVNYSTLTKTGERTITSAFYALNHALTARGVFKRQKREIEKVHIDTYTKMNEHGDKLKAMEEALRIYILLSQNKKVSDCTYDYILPEIKKYAEQNLENMEITIRPPMNDRNSQKTGYLTPNHYVM